MPISLNHERRDRKALYPWELDAHEIEDLRTALTLPDAAEFDHEMSTLDEWIVGPSVGCATPPA